MVQRLQGREMHRLDHAALVGFLMVSYKRLIDQFGEPQEPICDKVRYEWSIVFDDDTVATIYDYKTDEDKEQINVWNVGGHDHKKVLENLQRIFGSGSAVRG